MVAGLKIIIAACERKDRLDRILSTDSLIQSCIERVFHYEVHDQYIMKSQIVNKTTQ